MAEFKDFEEFDVLQQRIRSNAEKHKAQMEKADKAQTYKGIADRLNNAKFFLQNERNEVNDRIAELREKYSNKVIDSKRVEIRNEYNSLVNQEKTAVQKEIQDLTESKINLVEEMLTTPPTNTQLNLLRVLEMRSDIDSVELQSVVPAFFDNYNAMRVLQNIGEKNGVHITLPVQMNAREMFNEISRANRFLIGACEQLATEWKEMPLQYHAFFTVDKDNPDYVQDPQYRDFVATLDSVAQLQEVKAEKTALTPSEQVKIDYYFRDIADTDLSSIEALKHTQEVMTQHPEDVVLLKLSKYKDLVTEVEENATRNTETE